MSAQIIPSVLASNSSDFKKKIRFLESFFSLAQIDILDNTLVKNKSFANPALIRKIRTKLNYELHLMVADPLKAIKPWIGNKKVKKVIIHIECLTNKNNDFYDIIRLLSKRKIELGLAINPETKLSRALPLLPVADYLLVMGVHPGWSGQKFLPSTINKIKAAKKAFPKLPVAVDGGVTLKNYKKIISAGADILNAASMIYKMTPEEIKKIKREIR